MFASSNVTGVVQNAVKANNAVDVRDAKESRVVLIALLVSDFGGKVLKASEQSQDKISSLALASTILLLPFFISRNYWGTSSFLAWLTFIISIILNAGFKSVN